MNNDATDAAADLGPPGDVLAWAESELGRAIITVDRMAGGIDAQTFRLGLDDGAPVVLRLTEPGHHEDIDYLARVLDLLDGTAVPAPRRLAHSSSVGGGASPAMLQSLLPGDPTIPLEPGDAWLSELVATTLTLQQMALAEWMHDRVTIRWTELDQVAAEDLSPADQLLLQRLRDRGPFAPLTPVFGHDDYWVGNTLRQGDQVVGIVDWGHAGVVSAARDATYCAVDASLCYGVAVGDRLMDQFEAKTAIDPEEMLVWSARSVLSSRFFAEWLGGWNGLGVPVTHEQAARRRTELLDRTLARLG
jgi:aminoglycoside phosphotransferase (APT) family kinase protein